MEALKALRDAFRTGVTIDPKAFQPAKAATADITFGALLAQALGSAVPMHNGDER